MAYIRAAQAKHPFFLVYAPIISQIWIYFHGFRDIFPHISKKIKKSIDYFRDILYNTIRGAKIN